MTQEENIKPKAQKHPAKLMLVRYGRMGFLGWFEHNENHIPKTNPYVIIKTDRGLELGELVGPYNYRGGSYRSTPEQVEAYFTQGGKDFSITTGGRFVRFATHEDLREQEHLQASAQKEARCCQQFARELGLPMKIIEAEHLFGGERVVFYFTSEGRVDFRELVKRLAREYQTRIELRQIGSRDEARLISDYESCGLECCCKRFLKILEPVNMRMAKLQKATLDPSKISGHCGRLKCCLRYEDVTYKDLKNRLPQKNTVVQTPKGPGRVIDGQILTQLVVVQTDDGERHAWSLEDIQEAEAQKASGVPSQAPGGPAGGDRARGSAPGPRRETPADGKTPPEAAEVFEEIEDAFSEVSPESRPPRRPQAGGGGGGPARRDNNRGNQTGKPDAGPGGDGQNRGSRNRRGRGRRRNRPRGGRGPQDGNQPGGGSAQNPQNKG